MLTQYRVIIFFYKRRFNLPLKNGQQKSMIFLFKLKKTANETLNSLRGAHGDDARVTENTLRMMIRLKKG
jgi:hypothetical protein